MRLKLKSIVNTILFFLIVHFLASFPFAQINNDKNENIIRLEDNRQVSFVHPYVPHYGLMYVTNPLNPKHILAGSVIFNGRFACPSIVVYFSFDGGNSWEFSPVFSEDFSQEVLNPNLAFGPDGSVYLSCIDKDENSILIFRSEDGGRTWSFIFKMKDNDTFDWHNIIVDQSSGKYKGRLYLIGAKITDKQNKSGCKNLAIYFSEDKGISFKGPVKEIYCVYSFASGILSDGALIIVYAKSVSSSESQAKIIPHDKLMAIVSLDGAKKFTSPVVISKICRTKMSAVSDNPSLTIDKSSGPFKGRIYVTWLNARRGCYDVYLSWSSNKGETWSLPIMINDNAPPANPLEGPDHTCPGVAVNKDGVVGVLWYDRRDDGLNRESFTGFPHREIIVEHDYRWQIYFSASLDGGESFLPNIKVSKALFSNNAPGNWVPMAERGKLSLYLPYNLYPGAGKAGCFAASSEGRFHALWVDSRSGVSLIWTAPIDVKGKAFPNGTEEDAALDDVSPWIELVTTHTKFVPRDRIIEFDVHLLNKSVNQTIKCPTKVRLLGINSGYGRWEVVESDNQVSGSGAIWDFTDLIPMEKLRPGEMSGKKHVILRVKDEIPAGCFRGRQFLELRTKVLGKKEN